MSSASCAQPATGDSAVTASPSAAASASAPFNISNLARFDAPWALALLPDGKSALVTERGGKLKLFSANGVAVVSGTPVVDAGGQGGLGDVVLSPDFASSGRVYLSWVEGGADDRRGAVMGMAVLVQGSSPTLRNLRVIWRQTPKVTGRGHFSHRIAFSPDGQYLFLSSGERQKFVPAQDLSNNLGKVLRLLPDGKPAPGNPFASKGAVSAQIWSYGHRNLLGLKFDRAGRLWELDHGPAGGDELNLVKPGQNYGWPLVSDGDHYDGKPIPRHKTRPDLAGPAISWNPVIAPGDFVFYSGRMWPEWKDQAIIAALGTEGLVRVRIDGDAAVEMARYPLNRRIRAIAEAPDGSLLVLEDGKDARLLRLTRLAPAAR